MRKFGILFLLPSLAFSQDLLPCRCSVTEVKAAADLRGYSYPPQWVITDPVTRKNVGEMWDLQWASRTMYSAELMDAARCVMSLPAAPTAAQVDACRGQATNAVNKIEAARK